MSSTGGARVIPYPAAATIRTYYQALASTASLSLSSTTGSGTRATSGGVDVSGITAGSAVAGTRLEFLTVDVNNNGAADSTEGFFRIFHLYPSSYFNGSGYY